jgi:xylulokinase
MDQACSALGARTVREGIAEDSLGTVEALSFTVDRGLLTDELRRALLKGHYSVNCHVIDGKYLIMALILSAGSTVQWFRREFGGPDCSGDPARHPQDDSSRGAPVPSRLLFLPYLAGTGTPTMDPFARGVFLGLDLGIRKDDLLGAIHQGIVHEISVNLDRLEELGVRIAEIRCVGGGSNSDYRMQLRADMLGRTVVRMQDSEAAVRGAAVLAGTGGAVWSCLEEGMERVVREQRVFEPLPRYRRFYEAQSRVYRELYAQIAGLFREYATAVESLGEAGGLPSPAADSENGHQQ